MVVSLDLSRRRDDEHVTAILPLALLTGSVWSLVVAIAVSPVLPVLVAWLVACLYGPGTVTWEVGGKTLSPDRVALGWLLAFTVLRLLHSPSGTRPFRDGALAAFAAFTVMCLVEAAVMVWTPMPWDEMPPGIRLLYLTVLPLISYIAVHEGAGISPRRVTTVLCVFWGFGVYLALTAFFEQFGPRALVFPPHILRPRDLYAGRPVGPFLSTPLLGTMLVTSFAASVLLAREARGPLRLTVLISLPLLAGAILLTKTRSVWLGGAAVLWLLLFVMSRRSLRYGLLLVGLAGAVMFALVAGNQFVNPDRVEGEELVEYSFLQRLALMDGAITLFVQRPIFGWGFGQFERAVTENAGGGLLGFWATGAALGLSSHNLALRVLAETGVIGFGLFFCGWLIWFRRAWDLSWRSDRYAQSVGLLALSCYLAYWAEGMFHDPSYQLAGTLTAALLSGLVRDLYRRPLDPDQQHDQPGSTVEELDARAVATTAY